jgi:hypothetical protein
MRRFQSWAAVIVEIGGLAVAGCNASPASPVASATTPTSGMTSVSQPQTATGRVVDVLSGAPLGAVTLTVNDRISTTTAVDGTFQVSDTAAGYCSVVVSGSNVLQRQTSLPLPGTDAVVSLIPSQFDMATFEQMLRDGGSLRRWTTAPSLVIIDAVLQFSGVSDTSFTALDERMSADEQRGLVADLTWGLPQVTGNAFNAFASVSIESPAPGSTVSFFSREGRIVVARFKGLSASTNYWGYGRAAMRGSDVVAGAVMLDRDYDASCTAHQRSLRVHELGHALGYCHVTRRVSFMNASAVFEPNDFDRDATRIAFQRLPGNQAPDRDPARSSIGVRAAPLTWGDITP